MQHFQSRSLRLAILKRDSENELNFSESNRFQEFMASVTESLKSLRVSEFWKNYAISWNVFRFFMFSLQVKCCTVFELNAIRLLLLGKFSFSCSQSSQCPKCPSINIINFNPQKSQTSVPWLLPNSFCGQLKFLHRTNSAKNYLNSQPSFARKCLRKFKFIQAFRQTYGIQKIK